jgi:hypothetical protein
LPKKIKHSPKDRFKNINHTQYQTGGSIMQKTDIDSIEWQRLYREVRELLIYQARKNQPIGYGRLCGRITALNIKPTDRALHEVLDEISADEHNKGNGMLSVFCGFQDQDSNLPGNGFFKQAICLGIQADPKEDFVESEREKVHLAFKRSNGITRSDRGAQSLSEKLSINGGRKVRR